MMLTTTDLAADLQVTEAWVRERCADGTIPAHKIGREWRIDEHDLAHWREAQRFVPETPPPFEPVTPRSSSRGSVSHLLARRAAA